MPRRASEVHGIEVVGVAHDGRTTLAETESLQPDVLLVDLMLPGYRSIDLIRHVVRTQPQVRILAMSPDDPPHDRIMLAAEAGALGFVARDAPSSEYQAAIEQVLQGQLMAGVKA